MDIEYVITSAMVTYEVAGKIIRAYLVKSNTLNPGYSKVNVIDVIMIMF